jgi:hypothetical protein
VAATDSSARASASLIVQLLAMFDLAADKSSGGRQLWRLARLPGQDPADTADNMLLRFAHRCLASQAVPDPCMCRSQVRSRPSADESITNHVAQSAGTLAAVICMRQCDDVLDYIPLTCWRGVKLL